VRETLVDRLGDAQAAEVLELIADRPDEAAAILAEHGVDDSLYRTSMAIGQEAHVRMQAAWQKHVTNSVSKTINLPNSASVSDVKDAFRLAWETGCKAVTVYRDGSKSMQVLETGGEEAAEPAEHLLVPRQRPTTVKGVTERVRTGHGTMFVTINFDESGHPFEVFSTSGKSGGCDSANIDAISRLISLALRSGVDPDQVVEQLKGITCDPVWDGGTLVRSPADAVSLALSRNLHEDQGTTASELPAEGDSTAQLGLFPSTKERTAHANGNSNGNPIVASGARCPECSGYLIHQEGCLRCLDCGYNKCE
jgi:ribonucleoside-diphosphate reductase alpha chain